MQPRPGSPCPAGTLKDEQACYICGEFGHRSLDCPKQKMELYALPEHMQASSVFVVCCISILLGFCRF